MGSWNTLKEIAVSAISTVEDRIDTIYASVDYRGGVCPFNNCDVNDTLLPHVLRK